MKQTANSHAFAKAISFPKQKFQDILRAGKIEIKIIDKQVNPPDKHIIKDNKISARISNYNPFVSFFEESLFTIQLKKKNSIALKKIRENLLKSTIK